MNWNISAWSIRNPVPTLVLFLVITLAGAVSFAGLGIDLDPNTDAPMVGVTISQLGAAPTELETQVTRKVEQAVSSIGNIKHIYSTVSDGSSFTRVEFILGTSIDRATNDVRDAVSKIRSSLPQSIDEPVVQRFDSNNEPFIGYTLSSTRRSAVELSWVAENTIARELLTVPGVSQVLHFGLQREVRVQLDPLRLKALGVTADQVHAQIRALNIDLPGGRGEVGTTEQAIRTLGSAATVEQLRTTRIALPDGRYANLETLGTIVDGTAEQRWLAFFDGRPAVVFQVVRASGTNLVAVEQAVRNRVAEIQKSLPADTRIEMLWTTGTFVRESYDASVEAVLLGAGLAIVVIWLFLRDWRSTLIAALAIPLSVVPTFAVMYLAGFTLNNMTLLALALVIGILVDDAIVELENISRHIGMGKTPFEAAIEAADEIGLAVVATTFAIVAVFLPVAFMDGIQGQYFRQFGWTVAAAVLFSLVVARMLTPLMAAYLLKPHHQPSGRSVLMRLYDAVLRRALRYRLLTLALAIAFFVGSLLLIPLLPTSFIGPVDQGQSSLEVELPPGSSIATTRRAILQLSALVQKNPDVEHIYARAGAIGAQAGQVNVGRLVIPLKPRDQRPHSQQEFEALMRPVLNSVPGVRLSFSGWGGKALQIVLTGDNPIELNRAARDLTDQMRTLPELVDISSSAALLRPEITVRPNLARAAEQGVSVQAIARTAQMATLGDNEANLPKFTLPSRQINIRVQLDPAFRTDLEAIGDLQVTGNDGRLVPLKAVATVRMGSGAVQFERYDRARQVLIGANLAPGVNLGPALQKVHQLPVLRNLPASVTEKLAGDAENQRDVFNGFGGAIAAAILLIWAVLALLFGGFLQPLTIMMSLPLSLGGALIGLLVFQKSLGLYTLIGIVMLMGLVTKNAILLVEYCLVAMQNGQTRSEAIRSAGEARMRPILMTTVAMIAGMLPIALGIGAGSEARSPMAVAVVGGLLTSSLLTLVVVPVVFTYIDDLQNGLWRLLLGRRGEMAAPETSEQVPSAAAQAAQQE
ncbi:efflux RND transporter permease subunit [Gloeobacter kilaueensis]|uniref:Acriflavin resistance protein n=1 Tax=Gloeobacter kilaueensis (strain ATCC BAA-2537 / CCAP 1431/1 / ULC 316 / JS1) TaxID=1183438 RepID=U5QL06_GLOK1|nr:efflux RND transporter permease subunit [Gloeobacter kilaueensis]AGY59563.1 acriflavin resistance protein [Gloeobacter kilaueensis JS1]